MAAEPNVTPEKIAELRGIRGAESVVTAEYDQVHDLLDGYQVVHQQRREANGTGVFDRQSLACHGGS